MSRLRSLALSSSLLLAVACGGAGQPQSAADEAGTDEASPSSEASTSASSTPQDEQAPTTVEVASPAPEVGLQNLDRRSVSMDFGLTLLRNGSAAGVQNGNCSFEEERSHRVDAVDGHLITGLQVVYGKWEAKPLLGLRYEVPTDGKTYDITVGDGAAKVARAGKAPSADEKTAVLGEYGYVGKSHPAISALEAISWKQGASLPADPALVASLIGAIPGVDHAKSSLEATFEGIEGTERKVAKLHLKLTSALVSGATVFGLTLEGPATVDLVTGWTQSLDLSGDIVPSGQAKVSGKLLDVRGKGTATLKRSAEYR